MTITLSGDNHFAINEQLKDLAHDFKAKNGDLSIEKIDASEHSAEYVLEAITNLSLFSPQKLVILTQVTKNQSLVEQLESSIINIPSSTDVVIVEPKMDKRLSIYKLLKKSTDYRNLNLLDDHELTSWVSQTVIRRGANISNKDVRQLISYLGNDQFMLSNAIDKLILYNTTIDSDSIELLIDKSPQSTIFTLIDAVFNGHIRQALSMYKEQRELKVEPQQILAMLTWQLHVIAVISSAKDMSIEQVAQKSKINPFVLRKSKMFAVQMPLARLKRVINELVKIDHLAKTSPIDLDDALMYFFLRLADEITSS